MLRSASTFAAAVCLVACSAPDDQRADFLGSLQPLCGNSYTGQVVSTQEVDAAWRAEALRLGPVACGANEVRLPLAVGADTSRTWIVRMSGSGLSLRHQHLHADGEQDAVSMYGGFAAEGGTATRQDFPADEWTRTLFVDNDLPNSVANTWTLEIVPGETLTYRLSRPESVDGRDFRAEFDLAQPLSNPSP